MKIFVSHSTKFNYKDELYQPLRESELSKKHEFIFPHEEGKEILSKDIIRDCDLVVAEVSNPLFDQGLELGWANGAYVSIVCFYKAGSEVSNSLKFVTDSIFEYDSMETMIAKITEIAEAL
jgi:hypothetical protein